MDYASTASSIEAELRSLGAPERAAGEKRYLKSDLTHLGVGMPQIDRTVRAHTRGLDAGDAVGLARALWAEPIHERRMAAVKILEAARNELERPDLAFVLETIRDAKTWALVDPLATNVVGSLLARDPEVSSELDRWAVDPDFWVRRAALLAYLKPLKAGADFTSFATYADAMLEEKEFFIRKAIGWVLREMGRSRPDEVYRWLVPRVARASGVTVREAVKYLGEERRDELMTAYRESRKRTTSRRSSPSASR